MTVRTRIAPSPTGDPHVGTAYIALFNYCFARAHGGQFLLRIEDTDQVRSSAESEAAILRALRWVGLSWDEGPDVGGPHGPYRQSERSAIYREHADRLIAGGHAFRCFCTPERLDALRAAQQERKENPGYDGHCQGLAPDEVRRRLDAGEPHVVRMVVPREGQCVVRDRLRDPISIDWTQVDMQVLVKSDGLPTYHLANVVDDHLMGITHVIRGEEWISSAPKHLLLYQYFGWTPPELCHLPLLRNPDKSKLSKRKNPTGVRYYERMGFLPEALLNYLGLMAWSMPGEEEMFTLEQMVGAFDIDRVSLGGPVFDVDKLSWLNGRWIREALDDEGFAERVRRWALNTDYLMPIVPLVKQRVDRLSDLGPMTAFLFSGLLDVAPEAFEVKGLEGDDVCQALAWGIWRLDDLPEWTPDAISECLRSTADLMDVKLRLFLRPFFVALSGAAVSLPIFDAMAILGRDMTRARIRKALDGLGGASGKKEKKLRKALDARLASHAP